MESNQTSTAAVEIPPTPPYNPYQVTQNMINMLGMMMQYGVLPPLEQIIAKNIKESE